MTILIQSLDLTIGSQFDNHSPPCQLQWRSGQLLVRCASARQQLALPSIHDEQWLVQCLQHSPVRLVRLEPTLDEVVINRWVNACEQAGKPVFLWGTAALKQKSKPSQFNRYIQRVINAIAALVLLVLLSPIMLTIAALISISSPGAIFASTWKVGLRGKVFRAFQFRTTLVNDDSCTTPLGRWLRKYRLDELPQLCNVLRDEMSLAGWRCATLSDVVWLSQAGQRMYSKR